MKNSANQIAAIKAETKKANAVNKATKKQVSKAAASGSVKKQKAPKQEMLLDWKEDVLGLNRKYKDQTLSQVLNFLNSEKTVKRLLPVGKKLTPAMLQNLCPELLKDSKGNKKTHFNGPFMFLKALRKSDKETIAKAYEARVKPAKVEAK